MKSRPLAIKRRSIFAEQVSSRRGRIRHFQVQQQLLTQLGAYETPIARCKSAQYRLFEQRKLGAAQVARASAAAAES